MNEYRIIGYTNNRHSEVGIVVLLPAIFLLLSGHKKRAKVGSLMT